MTPGIPPGDTSDGVARQPEAQVDSDEMHEHGAECSDPGPGTRDRSQGECQEALDILYHFLDGELDEARRRAIQLHLDRCSSCLEVFDFEAELKIVVAQRCRESVPETLRLRVAAALTEASRAFPGSEQRAR